MEILIPFALRLASNVRRYLPHLSPWCRVRRNVEPTVLPRLREALNKLKTGSLSQSNAAPSKARISVRVSYQDHYLGDVAILNLGKTRLNEACCYWPLVSSGKLMLCPLYRIQGSKAKGYALTRFSHFGYQSIWS